MPEMFRRSNVTENNIPKPYFDNSPSEKDLGYIRQAQKRSKKSHDESTKVISETVIIVLYFDIYQVGAIIVHSNGEILGEGWNRMPAGCEEKFSWDKGKDPLKMKYYYGEALELVCVTIKFIPAL